MVGSHLRRCPLSFRHGARKGDGRAAPFAVVPCRFATGRGRGDGRGLYLLPLSPAVSPRGEEGGMVGPHRSPLSPVASGRGKVGAGEEERWPLTQWVHGHGTFPIRNSGF